MWLYLEMGSLKVVGLKRVIRVGPNPTGPVSLEEEVFRTEEGFGTRLLSIHNVRFLLRLMEDARRAIHQDRFNDFKQETLAQMKFDERGF